MSLLYKSVASQVVMLKLFLSSDHISAATGKTVAITISKNGGAFANPNAGATNATEVSNGWYKVTLDATDTGTEGDLVVRGTATSCDDTERVFRVHLPANFALTSIDSSGRLDVIKVAGTSQTAGDIYARLGAPAGASMSADIAAVKAETATIVGQTGTTGVVVGSMAANAITASAIATGAITATKFAAGAIDAAALATDAANEIRDAVWAKTLSELTGDPTATPTAADSQMLLFMSVRNKRETDSALGTDKIYNSAGSVILTATVTDAASVFTKAKYA